MSGSYNCPDCQFMIKRKTDLNAFRSFETNDIANETYFAEIRMENLFMKW